jgi:NAD(P)-dependent dehydrogenase (short-subunit alcohol dehydrogenase family)
MKVKATPKKSRPVALVTGSGKGLGAATARRLAEDGYTVVIHYFSDEAAAARTLAAVRRPAPDSSMLQADLREATQAHAMIRLVVDRYSRLDLLVNNIGGFIYKPLAQTTAADWNDVIGTNLNATFYLCAAAVPIMRKQRRGRIINFGAVDAGRMVVRPKTTPYYIAKTGVIMLTKQLAADNARYGITVNAISPGILESSVVKLKTPTGRNVQFSEIIDAIRFLTSAQAAHINGANLEVAGGFTFE